MWTGVNTRAIARRGNDADKKRKKQQQLGEHHEGSFGVYMAHKIQKLRNQNSSFTAHTGSTPPPTATTGHTETSSASGMFGGVHVYVDGYTVPSKEEIRQLLLLHGGGFEHYETSRVTHVVATHLPASKLLQYKKMRKPHPVVHPDWIVRSIEQNRVLPVQHFLYQGFADPTQSSLFSLSTHISSSLTTSLPTSSAKTPASSSSSEQEAERRAPTCNAAVLNLSGDHESKSRDPMQQIQLDVPDIDAVDDDDDRFSESEDDDEPSALVHGPLKETHQPAASTSSLHPVEGKESVRNDTRNKSTRDGPEFVRHFFAKSRLHHIGNWRSTFQQKAAEFLSLYNGQQIVRAPPSSNRRVILHVDMDCFFVAVAVRGRPELANVPVAVAHSGNSGGTSEISSCNYLARAKGIRAGMFMQAAKDLCPELVVLPYKFEEIEQVSFQIYTIFFSHTPYVQAMSCDEALLEFGSDTDGMEQARSIREEISSQTSCRASVGVSYNILLAKLASKEAKPDGRYHIGNPEQAEPFLLSLKIGDLPGVGRRMRAKLHGLGLEGILQLRSFPKGELVRNFGKHTSDMLFNFARGVDSRPLSVESNMTRKSVSAVVNFGIRFEKWEDATGFLMALAEELKNRLHSLKVRTECLTLLIKKRREGEPVEPWKYMGHGVCDNFSKSQVLAEPTDDDQVIGKACIELLRQLHLPTSDLRGVGIQATKLVSDSAVAGEKTRQLFRAWLSEPARQKDLPTIEETKQDVDTGDETDEVALERKAVSPRETMIGLSQVNMSVLDELPPWIREEVISAYSRHSTHPYVRANSHDIIGTTSSDLPAMLARKQGPSEGLKGKKPSQKPPRVRNLFNSSKTENSAGQQCRSHSGSTNALDDIRMSQIDLDVYYALPFALRKEIDRYAKKSTSSRPFKAAKSASPPGKDHLSKDVSLQASRDLPPIEDLFRNLLEVVSIAMDEQHTEAGEQYQASQNEAFDSIYSRILFEVESRALDRALKMLRYVRRKCHDNRESALGDTLRYGFNRVLHQVNQDIRHHFRAVLSAAAVAPL